MSHTHSIINGEEVELTSAQISAADAKDSEWQDGKPMRDWAEMMTESDVEDIPRWLEDHIENDHSGISSNPNLQAKYDAKKLKRSQKPE